MPKPYEIFRILHFGSSLLGEHLKLFIKHDQGFLMLIVVMLKTLEASLEGQSVLDVPAAQMVHEQLWVDKYAPKSFTELLSDEQTNREVHI